MISAVRESINTFLSTSRIAVPALIQADARFERKQGCFVTLKSNDEEKTLRGCIGFPEPVFKLSKALTEASIAAATEDPRFPPVKLKEMDSTLAEVSVLTEPQVIQVSSPKEIPSKIRVGKDGLILRWPFGSGLLLPQVAAEFGWDADEFLANLSMKAGAPPDQWLVPGNMVLKFQAQVFQEESPKGRVSLES